MLIDEDNIPQDPVNYLRALDLISYVASADEEDIANLKLHILSQSILRDNWTQMDVDNPLDSIRDTVFFRLIEMCYLQGMSLSEVLPEVEVILGSEELDDDLKSDANFRFLIQSGYEHLKRVDTKNMTVEESMEM